MVAVGYSLSIQNCISVPSHLPPKDLLFRNSGPFSSSGSLQDVNGPCILKLQLPLIHPSHWPHRTDSQTMLSPHLLKDLTNTVLKGPSSQHCWIVSSPQDSANRIRKELKNQKFPKDPGGILYLPHLLAFKCGKFQSPTCIVICSIYRDFWQKRFNSIFHFPLIYTFINILPEFQVLSYIR